MKPMSRNILILLFAILFVYGLFACSASVDITLPADGDTVIDGDEPADGDMIVDGDVEPDGDEPVDGDTEVVSIDDGSLTGTWAMKFAVTYTTILPILDRQVQLVLTGYALLPGQHTGTDFTYTEKICDFSMEVVEDIDFYVLFPEAAISAIPVEDRSAVLGTLETGTTWTGAQSVDLYGADATKFDDPLTDDIPLDPADPRLVDMDNDENIGFTAEVSGFVTGKVYIAMRFIRSLVGTLTSETLVEGQIESDVEMITLGSLPEILFFQLNLQKQDIPELNQFELVKLDSELSCAEILSQKDTLFSYNPMEHAVPLN